MHLFPGSTIKCMDIYLHFSAAYYSNYLSHKRNSSMKSQRFQGKGGEFWDPENQRFPKNRGLFKVKVSVKGGIFSTWRTLMGLTNSLPVGVLG